MGEGEVPYMGRLRNSSPWAMAGLAYFCRVGAVVVGLPRGNMKFCWCCIARDGVTVAVNSIALPRAGTSLVSDEA